MENEKTYKTSRILYIVEAMIEYLISLLIGGAYLAKVTSYIGMSDTLTGILTSFVSLGCGFQIISIFLADKYPVKRWVTLLHTINQLCFSLIYLVPFIKLAKEWKIVMFIAFLLLGYIINNVVNSPKINWYMSLVEDNKRGRFTANKEIISLVGGMIFSFAMGALIDYFEALGNTEAAFITCGLSILGLTLLHSATLIFSKEKPMEEKVKTSTRELLSSFIKDKDLFKVIMIPIFWNIVNYASTPFYGSYQIKELGFSMTFVSILSILYAIVRSIFSKPMGNLADKYSFAKMLNLCFIVMLISFTVNLFTIPENGRIVYTIHYMLYAVGMAGINSATINLIYDYVEKKKRMGALAISSTFSGIAGFLTTIAVSPLVAYIQNSGNNFLGLNIFAQQAVSGISVILLIGLIIYLNLVVKKIKRH